MAQLPRHGVELPCIAAALLRIHRGRLPLALQRNKNQKAVAVPSERTTKAVPNTSIMSLSPMIMSLGGNVTSI